MIAARSADAYEFHLRWSTPGSLTGPPTETAGGDQALALRAARRSYWAIGRRLRRISAALARRLARDGSSEDRSRRSQSSRATSETGPGPTARRSAYERRDLPLLPQELSQSSSRPRPSPPLRGVSTPAVQATAAKTTAA